MFVLEQIGEQLENLIEQIKLSMTGAVCFRTNTRATGEPDRADQTLYDLSCLF